MAMARAMGQMSPSAVIGDRVSILDAAEMIGMHPQSVRRLIKNGVIPASQAFGAYAIQLPVAQMFAVNYDTRPGVKPSPLLL